MNPIKQIRTQTAMSQQQLARIAGTSQPTIAAYENGRKSPTFNTLKRIARASGLEPILVFVPPMSREDRRSLAFHRAIAEKLINNPVTTVNKAKRNLKKLRSLHPDAAPLLKNWLTWLELPIEVLIEKLLDPGLHAREMRQVSPFSGILNARERSQVLKDFQLESSS